MPASAQTLSFETLQSEASLLIGRITDCIHMQVEVWQRIRPLAPRACLIPRKHHLLLAELVVGHDLWMLGGAARPVLLCLETMALWDGSAVREAMYRNERLSRSTPLPRTPAPAADLLALAADPHQLNATAVVVALEQDVAALARASANGTLQQLCAASVHV